LGRAARRAPFPPFPKNLTHGRPRAVAVSIIAWRTQLFDSTRDYVEQMDRDRYKQHQGKPSTHSANTTRRRRKANGGGAS
jgi:hypothetical protein